MTKAEITPTRPWQHIEEDIAVGHELQDDVTTPDEAEYVLHELTNLYAESKDAFERQTMTLSGPIPTEKIGVESLASVQKRKRLTMEEAQKAREEYNVRMGNLDENGFHVTR